jgi:hypothetical protein
MLARLSGKFAQRVGEWADVPEATAPEPWSQWSEIVAGSGKLTRYRAIGWDVQKRQIPHDVPHSFPALAAWITAAGREWLLAWRRTAGESHCLYVSCDALIVDRIGLENLTAAGVVHASDLGFLKVVCSADNLEIHGPHHYRIGDRVVVAGRDRSARMIDSNKYRALRFQSLKETLNREGENCIRVDDLVHALPIREAPGTIGPDGWVTPPIVLEENRPCALQTSGS